MSERCRSILHNPLFLSHTSHTTLTKTEISPLTFWREFLNQQNIYHNADHGHTGPRERKLIRIQAIFLEGCRAGFTGEDNVFDVIDKMRDEGLRADNKIKNSFR